MTHAGPDRLFLPREQVLFYRPEDPYGCFSNFSDHGVRIYGRRWPTSEHAFQAMKFEHRPDLVDRVFRAGSPGRAASIGRDRGLPLRRDWDLSADLVLARIPRGLHDAEVPPPPGSAASGLVFEYVKDVFMFEVVSAKFAQHREIADVLLSTSNRYIVEDAVADPYWGRGSSRVGRNKLGRILMLVRDGLRRASS